MVEEVSVANQPETQVDETIESVEEVKIPVSYAYAEETLLSIFIQDDDCAAFIAQSGLRDIHFLKRKNRLLFPIILNMRLTKGVCNFDLVAQECEKTILPGNQTLLDFVGGLSELTKMMHMTDSNAMDLKITEEYIRIVVEQYRLSQIHEHCQWLLQQRKFDEGKIIDKVASLQHVLQEDGVDKYGLVSMEDLILDAFDRFNDRKDNPEKYEPIPTGFAWLDQCKAVAKKRTMVLGARTSVGKSIMSSNIAVKTTLSGYHTLIFTPELDKQEYIDRMLCGLANVSIDRWKKGLSSKQEVDRIGMAQRKFLSKGAHNLYIEDRGSQTISFILNSIKRHMLSHPVDVVIIDYLQKLRYYGADTKKAITDMMDKICAFGKDNNIAFIVVSQLRRGDKGELEPQLNDLKESGDIENFADCVVLLHRPSITKISERGKGWYKVAKNRQGSTTDNVSLIFNESSLKFTEAESPEDVEELSDEDQEVLNEQGVMQTIKSEDKRLSGN